MARNAPIKDRNCLTQFLGVTAELSPPLLHGDIICDSTKPTGLLRSYYQFAPSESTLSGR